MMFQGSELLSASEGVRLKLRSVMRKEFQMVVKRGCGTFMNSGGYDEDQMEQAVL